MRADVERIIDQCRSISITLEPSPDGAYLYLHHETPPPEDLRQQLRQHKADILAMLAGPKPSALDRALTQKSEEIVTMQKRMAAPCNADDAEYQQWCGDQIRCLTGHITEIKRYLHEGRSLGLPPCCNDDGHLCLIAMRRFNGCLMHPRECGFSVRG